MRAERGWPLRLLNAVGSAPKRSKPLLAFAGIAIIATIGFVDYLTGYEASFSLFYLLPIALVTWSVGRITGVAASVLAAVAWMIADAEAGHIYSRPAILYWNTGLRLGFFLTVTLLLAVLQDSLKHERQLSRLDSLTGAVNGRYFMELIQVEIERASRYRRPFTLVYFDIDDFKQVNDRFGHNSGDTVLRTVATVTKTHLRATDTVTRLGGDEFAVLLPETDPEAARAAVTKMRSTLLEQMGRDGWPVTFSMGVLTCLGAAQGPDALLKLVDGLISHQEKREGQRDIRCDGRPSIASSGKRSIIRADHVSYSMGP
jgi:diguanylate cyclase (GGDEF)-like protein